MKKLIICLIAITPFFIFAGCSLEGDSGENESSLSVRQLPVEYKEYKSRGYGFKILYPPDWSVEERESGIVAFSSPREGPYDDFAEALLIRLEQLPAFKNKQDFLDYNLERINSEIEDIEIIEISDITVASIKAQKIIYQGRVITLPGETQDRLHQWMRIAGMFDDNQAFFMHYQADLDKYGQYIGPVNKMIRSFELID